MEILNTERLTHERWVNLFVRSYRHQGHEGRWCFASRHTGEPPAASHYDAVVIVPVLLAEGEPPRLVMVREFRVPVGDYVYGLPAGLAEEGETPEAVARRELKEETGLEVGEVKKVSPSIYSSAGLTDESSVMVFVTARRGPDGERRLDRSEDMETVLLDYREVCELCDSPARVDGKAWVVLYMYQSLGRLA
jgi:ADP-ribose pyrophosphatase